MNVHANAPAAAAAADPALRRAAALRRADLAAIVMLVVQYGIGMYLNLYVTVPAADAGHGIGKAIANGPAALSVHAVFGIVLLLAALGVGTQAVLARQAVHIAAAVIGLIGIIGAALAGSAFVDKGADAASMAMAVFTGVALLSYGLSLFLLPSARRSRQS